MFDGGYKNLSPKISVLYKNNVKMCSKSWLRSTLKKSINNAKDNKENKLSKNIQKWLKPTSTNRFVLQICTNEMS